MWKKFYLSQYFDLLMLGLLILIVIGVFIGLRLYFLSLREKKKQTQLMEQTLRSFEKLSQLVQGDSNMKFDLNDILAGHQSTTNPTQASAMSKDIATGLKNLTGVGAALAGNLGRIAVNTSIQQQTKDLGTLNQQVAEFAEVLAGNTAQDGEKAAVAALEQQQQQQAIAETAAAPEVPSPEEELPAEELPPPPEEVQVDLSNLEPASEVVGDAMSPTQEVQPSAEEVIGIICEGGNVSTEVPFTMEGAREVIRKIPPLRLCLEAHKIDPSSEFLLEEPECLVPKLIQKLEIRDGMKLEKGEKELLVFLKGLKS